MTQYHITLDGPDDFEGWRDAVRGAIAANIAPSCISWQAGSQDGDLFADLAAPLPPSMQRHSDVRLPRALITLARTALLHRDPERFSLLHHLIAGVAAQRIGAGDLAHPIRARAESLARSVRRDIHKMRAFVRFREIGTEDGASRYVAWFEPDHHIVRANAKFFVDRFSSMAWSILTPEASIHWDGQRLEQGPGALRSDAPDGDPVEDSWKRYYASIFNPARLKVGAMLKEMPKKYWANMPETALIGELVAGAHARSAAMIQASANSISAE